MDAPAWVTLTEGEEVVWTGHPSLVVVSGSLLAGTVLIALGIVASLLAPPPLNLGGPVLIALGVLVVGAALLERSSTAYVITTEEVYAKTGLVSREVRNVRLDRVQNIGFTQSVGERPAGVGTVHVDTAGSGETEFLLSAVPDPGRVNGLITEQLSRPA
jgi:uncharacterized membrane protein YdbT with pleckstrin-like domain